MKNKGFTLIELLAVIAIISIIAVIATPNVINMVDNSKKSYFITDAQQMISLAKYKYKLEKYQELFTSESNSNCKIITADNLGFAETKEADATSVKDPDGNTYNLALSAVKVCSETENGLTKIVYYVKLSSSGQNARGIKDYVKESNLTKSDIKELASN